MCGAVAGCLAINHQSLQVTVSSSATSGGQSTGASVFFGFGRYPCNCTPNRCFSFSGLEGFGTRLEPFQTRKTEHVGQSVRFVGLPRPHPLFVWVGDHPPVQKQDVRLQSTFEKGVGSASSEGFRVPGSGFQWRPVDQAGARAQIKQGLGLGIWQGLGLGLRDLEGVRVRAQ